jgi:hypothetical protein
MISVEKARPSVPFPVLDMRDLGDAAEASSGRRVSLPPM